MRVIAHISGSVESFSWGGSGEVVLFASLVGVPVALGYFAFRDRIPSASPLSGLMLGSGMFTLLALAPPESARSALAATPDPPLVTAMLFLSLLLFFGAGLEWSWAARRRKDRYALSHS